MRKRNASGAWHDLTANPMAYCLSDVRDRLSIVHLSAGALPTFVPSSRHEPVDLYWLHLQQCIAKRENLPHLPRFLDW